MENGGHFGSALMCFNELQDACELASVEFSEQAKLTTVYRTGDWKHEGIGGKYLSDIENNFQACGLKSWTDQKGANWKPSLTTFP